MQNISHSESFLKEFKQLPNWLLWREEKRKGKPTKVPYSVRGTLAKSNDPSTWTTYDKAAAVVDQYDGLGFAINDGHALIDVDGCRDPETGEISTWGQLIVDYLHCPTEISPSGRGLHIYVKALNAPRAVTRTWESGENKRGIEFYPSGRYSTVTFNHLPGTPIEIPEMDLTQFLGFVESGRFDPPDKKPFNADGFMRFMMGGVVAPATKPLDLEKWLTTYSVAVLERKPDGIMVVPCPGTHGDYDQYDGHAFLKQLPSGALTMGCLHASCSLFHETGNHWREFRQIIESTSAHFVRKEYKVSAATTLPTEADAPWLFPADSFLTERLPERKVLLRDKETNAPLFYASSINQIFAFRGQGKTVVAHALTGCMVNGGEFLRYQSEGGLRAVIMDGELPLVQLQDRLKTFVGDTSGRLALMSPDRMPDKVSFPVLARFADQVQFLAQIQPFHPDIIVFDTLTRCFKFDTNDPDLCAIVNDFLLELRFRGYCVIVIHHAGKSGTQRGRTDLDDNLDISIKLSAPSYWQPGDGLQFQWDFEKVRHAANLPGFFAELDPTGLWAIKTAAHEEEVLEFLYQGKSVRAVASELDMSKSQVQRIRAAAKKKGARFPGEGTRNED